MNTKSKALESSEGTEARGSVAFAPCGPSQLRAGQGPGDDSNFAEVLEPDFQGRGEAAVYCGNVLCSPSRKKVGEEAESPAPSDFRSASGPVLLKQASPDPNGSSFREAASPLEKLLPLRPAHVLKEPMTVPESIEEVNKSDWIYSHVYPDARRPGVVVTERLVLRTNGLCRWSRFLDTFDSKGVRAQGEFWPRESVKTVRFSTKTGDPSREFSLFGERQAVKHRALFVWLWEVAPVFTAWLSFILNPLSVTLVLSAGLTMALWFAFPWDGSRYVMSQAANAEALYWALPLAALSLISSLGTSWWLRLGGEHVAKDDVYSSIRPHAAAVSRWWFQRPMNGIFFGLFGLWCIFVLILAPLLAVQGRRTSTCQAGGCESSLGVVDGTCGVNGCGCGDWADLSCSAASTLSPYCPVSDSPLCSEDSSKGESDPSPALKAEPVPYHKVTLTFDTPHRGPVVFTVGADEDVQELTRLLLPEAFASPLVPTWAQPPAAELWGGDEVLCRLCIFWKVQRGMVLLWTRPRSSRTRRRWQHPMISSGIEVAKFQGPLSDKKMFQKLGFRGWC
ncbi:hypothetical protein AK812_SmicGene12255 [Symbiodinium microadriaticum]|uniref:Uncharacterized protein n=1 Tax=Symbiodinium microadriaticum TaxID=2951 RepID=A0A1Q9EB55_SYMMI|nr:hypothetical protein AK812_SmicGene12255 [Symbiodinium microadriaticum]